MEFILLAVVMFIVFALLLAHNINVRFTIQGGGAVTPPSFPKLDIDVSNAISSTFNNLNKAITDLNGITNTFKDNNLNFAMPSNLETNITNDITAAKTALTTALTTLESAIKSNLTIKI